MPRKLHLMSHHKTGTNVMMALEKYFERLSRFRVTRSDTCNEGPPKDPNTLFIYFVRHPLEVIVSARDYHLDVDKPSEQWIKEVHHWRGGLYARHGLPYQQRLRSRLPVAQITLEMQSRSRRTINCMYRLADIGKDPRGLRIKLEDIKEKPRDVGFLIAAHLNIANPRDIISILTKKHGVITNSENTQRWPHVFARRNYIEFLQFFPSDTVERIGYDPVPQLEALRGI